MMPRPHSRLLVATSASTSSSSCTMWMYCAQERPGRRGGGDAGKGGNAEQHQRQRSRARAGACTHAQSVAGMRGGRQLPQPPQRAQPRSHAATQPRSRAQRTFFVAPSDTLTTMLWRPISTSPIAVVVAWAGACGPPWPPPPPPTDPAPPVPALLPEKEPPDRPV
jgi:hypothetical protein